MSTSGIRNALHLLKSKAESAGDWKAVHAGFAEVEAIERAARAFRSGDRPYAVADAKHLMTQIAEEAP